MNKPQCTGIVTVPSYMREGHRVAGYQRKCGRHAHANTTNSMLTNPNNLFRKYWWYQENIYPPEDKEPFGQDQDKKQRQSPQTEESVARDNNDTLKSVTAMLLHFLRELWQFYEGITADTLTGYLQAVNKVFNSDTAQVLWAYLGQPDPTFTDQDLIDELFQWLADRDTGEGVVEHSYFDSKGNLTMGCGGLIRSREEFMSFNWTIKGIRQTDTQKSVLYDKIMIEKERGRYKGLDGNQQKFMKDYGEITRAEAEDWTKKHIRNTALPQVKQSFKNMKMDFNAQPPSVRIVAMDIVYNSGAFNKSEWPKMITALAVFDYKTAAEESHRADVQDKRNEKAKDLILRAKEELEHKLTNGTWR